MYVELNAILVPARARDVAKIRFLDNPILHFSSLLEVIKSKQEKRESYAKMSTQVYNIEEHKKKVIFELQDDHDKMENYITESGDGVYVEKSTCK